jgi:hypothetical protein
VLRFLRELYFTAFTLFFRLGVSWTPQHNAAKGVAGVAVIEALLLLAIDGWIEVVVGRGFLLHLPKYTIVFAFFAICAANHYVLVVRNHGIRFQQEFKHLSKTRKTLLVWISAGMMLMSIAFFLCSASAHRKVSAHHSLTR